MLSNVVYSTHPFEELVLPAGQKELLLSLAVNNISRSKILTSELNDLIPSKGKGNGNAF